MLPSKLVSDIAAARERRASERDFATRVGRIKPVSNPAHPLMRAADAFRSEWDERFSNTQLDAMRKEITPKALAEIHANPAYSKPQIYSFWG